ncbi:MAG: acyltransferase [Novosphingobium sp.]
MIQVLRGIAASWVVLCHASEAGHIDSLKASLPQWFDHVLFEMGHMGVAIFFALSGFVVAHSIHGDNVTPSYLGRFALRRSIRLDPPYWAAIAFAISLAIVSAKVKGETFVSPSAGQTLAHLTYTQTLLGYEQINLVFWTLCYEVQFYLVLVSAALVRHRGSQIVLFAMALIWGMQLAPSPPGLFLGFWHTFFLGVLAYWSDESRTALIGLALLSIGLIASAPDTFTFVAMLTAWFLWGMRRQGLMHLGSPPLLWLGAISYSLYLVHNPVTGAVSFVVRKMELPEPAMLPLIVVGCLAVAGGMWFAIERPFQTLARRIRLGEPREIAPVPPSEHSDRREAMDRMHSIAGQRG